MTIDWSLFLPAMLLLLFPADRLLSTKVQLRTFESFRSLENSPRFRPWWWVPALWLDPIRGFAGALLLKWALAIVSARWTLEQKPAYWLLVGLLGFAVLCQSFTRRDREALLAPMGFVAGIVLALMPPAVALIGFATAVLSVFAFHRFHAFFTAGLAMVALLGVLLDTHFMWLAPAVVVLAVPLALGAITGRSLELPTRNDTGPVHPLAPHG
jgi:hypothetical protein